MIRKINILKNIGKFYSYTTKGDGLDWHKNTFLFAPNAYGKSTLVHIFKSLCTADSKIMLSRKTVNSTSLPEAVINLDGFNHIFDGNTWNQQYQAIHIFDIQFIHDNIFTTQIEFEHKKKIHKIIIGEHGIRLADDYAKLKSDEKVLQKQIDNLLHKFRSANFLHSLQEFLDIPDSEKDSIAEQIKKLNHDIKSKESEALVGLLSSLQKLNTKIYNLTALKELISKKIVTIHKDAEKKVLAHIQKNYKEKTQARDFIRQGLDSIQDGCPFCGQDLKSVSELITSYRDYFDDSFRIHQKKLTEEAEKFSKWNFDEGISNILAIHNGNITLNCPERYLRLQ